jgi:GAF domain-containing protein
MTGDENGLRPSPKDPLEGVSTPRPASSGNPFRAILDVGAALVSSLVLEDVFANITERIGEAMAVWGVEIQTYDAGRGQLVHEACWRSKGLTDVDRARAGETSAIGQRPSLAPVLNQHEIVEHHSGDPALPYDERRYFEQRGFKTTVYVPLTMGGEMLGVLTAIEARFVRTFTSIEIDLLRQLCDLASVAIHNARLYRRIDEQKRHTDSLLEASQALSASLVLEEVMALVADGTYRALGVGSVDIYEYRSSDDSLVCVASRMPHDPQGASEWIGTVLGLDEHPSFRRVFERGTVIEYQLDDPGLPALDRELFEDMREFGEKSVIETGLFFGDEIMGCISLCTFEEPRHLNAEERGLLIALASTAAMAIRNAKMFRLQEMQNRHRTSLLDAGRAITATVVLDEVLARITREATLALDASQACIYYYDAGTDTITYKALYEKIPSPAADDDADTVYDLRDYPGDRAVLEARAPVVHQLTDPDLSPDRRAGMAAYDEHTTLNVPLRFGDQSLGILRLYEMEHPRIYTESEIELAGGLGEQAAIAINNARLYGALDEQRRHLDSLLAISRTLAGGRDTAAIHATITRMAAEAFGADRTIIYELDRQADTLTARACFERVETVGYDTTGVAQDLDHMPADRAILDGMTPVVEQLSDDTLDHRTRANMERWDEKTCLNVPLAFRGRTLGILMLIWTDRERHFSKDEIDFAVGIGEQAALALGGAGQAIASSM